MSWYCDIAPGHPIHQPYHDREYGFPMRDETGLFERLSLEIFQAGLSWLLVLRKRSALNHAFAGFDVDRVAAFDDGDVARLLSDPDIIRNRLKIAAVIDNARRVRALRHTGGFHRWLDERHPMSPGDWLAACRTAFRFMGPEVVREFLISTGYLAGAHREDCPVYAAVVAAGPPWAMAAGGCTGAGAGSGAAEEQP
jgi:DNA-3-methyladenine glycosylase I